MITLSEPKNTNKVFLTEGRHEFKIVDVVYDADFGQIKIDMVTQDGAKATQRYNIETATGETNEQALNLFSWFARCTLKTHWIKEVNENDLIGKFISLEVVFKKYVNKNGETKTATNFTKYQQSEGWVETTQADEELPF